ncbi:MAG: hypothetical protein AAF556_10565 [Pseudomonadota bacterium]
MRKSKILFSVVFIGLFFLLAAAAPGNKHVYGAFDQNQCTRFGDSLETPAAWTTCVQDSDCVLGRNICGFPMGLNAGHVADQDQLNQCVGPRIACPMIYLDPNNYRAACQAGQCQAAPKDDGATAQ